MNSHVHIGLYDALREAGASEERRGREPLIFPLGRISPPRKTCCEPSPRWIGEWRS